MKKPVPPPVVLQTGNEDCWAAALDSWLAAVDRTRHQSRQELLAVWRAAQKGMSPKGGNSDGLFITPLRYTVASKGMTTTYVTIREFTGDFIRKKLEISYLFLAHEYERLTPWWHCVVLYGAALSTDHRPIFYVMDPAAKREGPIFGYRTWTLEHVFKTGLERRVILGWKANGPGEVLYPEPPQ
jgi:hypothetical protein